MQTKIIWPISMKNCIKMLLKGFFSSRYVNLFSILIERIFVFCLTYFISYKDSNFYWESLFNTQKNIYITKTFLMKFPIRNGFLITLFIFEAINEFNIINFFRKLINFFLNIFNLLKIILNLIRKILKLIVNFMSFSMVLAFLKALSVQKLSRKMCLLLKFPSKNDQIM